MTVKTRRQKKEEQVLKNFISSMPTHLPMWMNVENAMMDAIAYDLSDKTRNELIECIKTVYENKENYYG